MPNLTTIKFMPQETFNSLTETSDEELYAVETTIPTKTSELENDSKFVSSQTITTLVSLTQAEYDALSTKDSNTIYYIIEG